MDRCVHQVDGTVIGKCSEFFIRKVFGRLREVSQSTEVKRKYFCSCRRRFGFGDIDVLRTTCVLSSFYVKHYLKTKCFFVNFLLNMSEITLNFEQKKAVDLVTSGHNVFVGGRAGTGKTFTAKYLVKLS